MARGFLRFLGLTALRAEGCGGALRAQIIKKGGAADAAGCVEGLCSPPFPSFRPERSGVEKSHAPNDRKAGPRPPSFRPKRSGVEWRNLPPLMVRAALRQEISRLRVSSERFASTPPYRHIPPLEMTMLAGTIGHTFGMRVHRAQKGRFLGLTGLWPEGS